jgi:hypothetical protein
MESIVSNGQSDGPNFWTSFIHQLPAILTALAACIGAWGAFYQSRQSNVQLEQHGEVQQEVKAKVERTEEKVDKAADAAVAVKAKLDSKDTGKDK